MESESKRTDQMRPLVFDLDGTLIDSRRDIAAACNFALRSTGRAELPIEVIASYVGRGALALLREAVGEVGKQELLVLLAHFQDHYRRHPTDFNAFMPGALEAMSRNQGRAIALCTNKPWPLTEVVLESLGWDQAFDAVVAPGENEQKKPHPEPLQRIARLLDVPPQSLIMIGDAPPDMGAGHAVGAHTIGVRGGFASEAVLLGSNPHVVLDSLTDLGSYLREASL